MSQIKSYWSLLNGQEHEKYKQRTPSPHYSFITTFLAKKCRYILLTTNYQQSPSITCTMSRSIIRMLCKEMNLFAERTHSSIYHSTSVTARHITVFGDETPCHFLERDRHFRRTYLQTPRGHLLDDSNIHNNAVIIPILTRMQFVL
jgi:hypothetical protein